MQQLSDIDVSVGDLMRKLRELYGWSQEQVADGMHIRAEKLSAFEHNSQLPELDELERFRRLLDLPQRHWNELVKSYLTTIQARFVTPTDNQIVILDRSKETVVPLKAPENQLDPALIPHTADALGIPPADLMSALARARRQWHGEEERLTAARAVPGGQVTQALTAYYTRQKLARGGLYLYTLSMPQLSTKIETDIACRREWVERSIKLGGEQEVCQLIEAPPPAALIPTERVADAMAYVESMGFNVWEAPIYRLVNLDMSADCLTAAFSLDWFSCYRFLGGPALMDELIRAMSATPLDVNKVLARRRELLPLHELLVPDGDSLLRFRDRLCGGGIVVLTAMARPAPENDFIMPIYRRSQRVSDSQGAFTTVPRGYHQPMVVADTERNLSFSVYRELYEELFGGEDAERGVRHYRPDWFFRKSEPLQWLLTHPEAYTLECTGFGMNLRLGDYTFVILLAVHDEEFYRRYGDFITDNWEASEEVGDKQLISSKHFEKLSGLIQNATQWDGAALFGFVEGLLRLRQLASQRVNLPEIIRLMP
jgi:transcriptional regulator with XRE-family HTH domain